MRLLLLLPLITLLSACAPVPQPPAPSPQPLASSPAPQASGPQPLTPSLAPPAPSAQPSAPSFGRGVPLDAAFSPDGLTIAVATARELRLHTAARPAEVRWAVALGAPAAALALSPDGATIAVASGDTVELRAASDGAPLRTIAAGAAVSDLAIAPDGATLAAALADGRLALWGLAGDDPPFEQIAPDDPAGDLLPGPLTAIAFSPTGDLAASGDENGNVLIWRVADGMIAQAFSVGLRVVADVAFSPDGLTVAAASEGWRSEPGAAWLWSIDGAGEPRWLTVEDEQALLAPATRLAFRPDGAELALGAADGSLLRWDLPDGGLAAQVAGGRAAITALAYSPAGAGMLSAARDGTLRTWDAAGAETGRFSDLPAISAVAVIAAAPSSAESPNPQSPLIAAGGEDGSLRVWPAAGAPGAAAEAHVGPVNALAVSPDQTLLASAGDDGAVRLWALPGGEPWGELRGHIGPALSLAFSPDGALLASGGADGTIWLWRLPEGVPERTIVALESDGVSGTAILGLAIGPDGVLTAGTPDRGVARWSVTSGEELAPIPFAEAAWVLRVAYSPDGALLAALESGGQLALWRLSDGALLGAGRAEGAAELRFGAGAALLTAGGPGGLQRWAARDDALAAEPLAPSDARAMAVGAGLIVLGSGWGWVEVATQQ